MLTDIDIQKLQEVLATKGDLALFATKEDFEGLRSEVRSNREMIQALLTSVENLAGSIDDLLVEYRAVSVQLTRHEKWIKQIAEKVGINLEM